MLDRFSITLRAWGGDKLNCQGPIHHCICCQSKTMNQELERACEWSENRERAVSGDRCSITLRARGGDSVAGGEQEDTFADTCRHSPISHTWWKQKRGISVQILKIFFKKIDYRSSYHDN